MCSSKADNYHHLCDYMKINCTFAFQCGERSEKEILRCRIAVGDAPSRYYITHSTIPKHHPAAEIVDTDRRVELPETPNECPTELMEAFAVG